MPTYEYECPDCAHRFEEFQSITAKPIKKCPKCGKRKVRRLIGMGAGVIFKGSGFYETDYVKKSKPSESDSDSAKSKDEPKPPESKKSEPKKESKSKKDSKPAKKD